jgi:hypothetical protein
MLRCDNLRLDALYFRGFPDWHGSCLVESMSRGDCNNKTAPMKVATNKAAFSLKVIPDVRTPHGRKRLFALQPVFLGDRIGEPLPLDYLNVTHHG